MPTDDSIGKKTPRKSATVPQQAKSFADGTAAQGDKNLPNPDDKARIVNYLGEIGDIYHLLINMGRKAVAAATFAVVVLGFLINDHHRRYMSAESMGEWTPLDVIAEAMSGWSWYEHVIIGALLVVVHLCFYIVLRGRRLRRHVFKPDAELVKLFAGSSEFYILLAKCRLQEDNIRRELRFASYALMAVMLVWYVAGFAAAFHFFGAVAVYAGLFGSVVCAFWQWRRIDDLRALEQYRAQTDQNEEFSMQLAERMEEKMKEEMEYHNMSAARFLLFFFVVCAALFAGAVLGHWVDLI